MAIPDLVLYIQEQTQQGISATVLREALLQVGWHENDIDNALHDVAAGLHPVTAGASIHDDLAQVRGMVAHLASRVKRIEGTLSVAPSMITSDMPMLTQPQSLAAPRSHAGSDLMRLFVFMAIAFGGGIYLVLGAGVLPLNQIIGAGILALGLLFGSVVVMRRHSWLASTLAGASIALCFMIVDAMWRGQKVIEMQTAVAFGVLLLVVMAVMERWIRRFEQ